MALFFLCGRFLFAEQDEVQETAFFNDAFNPLAYEANVNAYNQSRDSLRKDGCNMQWRLVRSNFEKCIAFDEKVS